MGKFHHNLHSVPGMGLRSTDFQRINQQRDTEEATYVHVSRTGWREHRGISRMISISSLRPRDKGVRRGEDRHLRRGWRAVCFGGLSRALSPAPPGDGSSWGSHCCLAQKTAISKESNHLIIRLTDNTSTPLMVYLFTYYFNTLLNLFIK